MTFHTVQSMHNNHLPFKMADNKGYYTRCMLYQQVVYHRVHDMKNSYTLPNSA
jgi:hypothetical protein